VIELGSSAAALRLAIAALVGLAVGVERQWSGHATGPGARFAGLRTFLLLGGLGGSAGLLLARGHELAATAFIAGGVLFAVVALVLATRRPDAELDATTEVAGALVVALGVLAGLGAIGLAAGAGSVVVLALYEKGRLHDAVRHIGEPEMRAAFRFSVLALVVLPLLPPTWSVAGFTTNPRGLWMVVLFFSGLNFAGYIARRVVRADRGYAVTGLLGGLISSTVVTLDFSRHSRAEPELGRSLAAGVVGACTVLVPRVLFISLVLNASVAVALVPYLAPVLVAGSVAFALLWRGGAPVAAPKEGPPNPLRLGMAMKMAVAFQAAIMLVELVRTRWAATGLYTTAVFLGITDADALAVSMTQAPDGMTAAFAARAIAVGILASSLAKLVIAVTLGGGRFRLLAGAALLAMSAAAGGAIWLL